MFINGAHLYLFMKFAIALENTKDSISFLDIFFNKFDLYNKYSLDIIVVQEFVEQKEEIESLKKLVLKKLKEKGIKGDFIVEKGEPIARILYQLKELKINMFICHYEHSIFSTSFFEQVMDEIEIPVLTLK